MDAHQDFELSREALIGIADVLMGAALADGEYSPGEAAIIERILTVALGVEELPADFREHLEGFDPDTFDLEQALAAANLEREDDRCGLMLMAAKVVEADAVTDELEDWYLQALAAELGMEDVFE